MSNHSNNHMVVVWVIALEVYPLDDGASVLSRVQPFFRRQQWNTLLVGTYQHARYAPKFENEIRDSR